ncbi:hypothetical protein BIU82_06550 [Arthrobacter sp. SW1]|nr:hypothetical protein BIU82_06550 [Arthrobacter sp. SW1]
MGAGAEVRINGVVHVNSSLDPETVVSIGWVAVGNPASILPPTQHDDIWSIQRTLDFPGTVYGVSRETSMTQLMEAQSAHYGEHRNDTVLDA